MSTPAPAPADDLGEEEIPLPPAELLAEMVADEEAQATKTEPAKPARPAPEVADLKFVGEGRSTVIDIDFHFELDGVVITSVPVRRLNGYEVANFVREHLDDDGHYDRYELYACMTGLPAPVLRGLDQDDGLRVTGTCARFLPRILAAGA